MAEARYYYATLYRFTTDAALELHDRFQNTMRNRYAVCQYDATHDMFELRCPTDFGAEAYHIFEEVISDYIKAELATTEETEVQFCSKQLSIYVRLASTNSAV